MKIERARTRRLRWWQHIGGRLSIPAAVDPQRPSIRLNRYPHKIIGVCVYPGGRRYLSWVWPLWFTGLLLTDEQFDRHARALLDVSHEGESRE